MIVKAFLEVGTKPRPELCVQLELKWWAPNAKDDGRYPFGAGANLYFPIQTAPAEVCRRILKLEGHLQSSDLGVWASRGKWLERGVDVAGALTKVNLEGKGCNLCMPGGI